MKDIIGQYFCSEKCIFSRSVAVMVKVHASLEMAEQQQSSTKQGCAQLLCWTVEKQSLSV